MGCCDSGCPIGTLLKEKDQKLKDHVLELQTKLEVHDRAAKLNQTISSENTSLRFRINAFMEDIADRDRKLKELRELNQKLVTEMAQMERDYHELSNDFTRVCNEKLNAAAWYRDMRFHALAMLEAIKQYKHDIPSMANLMSTAAGFKTWYEKYKGRNLYSRDQLEKEKAA